LEGLYSSEKQGDTTGHHAGAASPSPRSSRGRVGVTGCIREMSSIDRPVPPHPEFKLRLNLSRKRGEVGPASLAGAGPIW